ncbi:FAD-binding oxidoreductase [Fodinicurvata sp. EGI_FJ10296]|uniref:NAD(P)/FAD-dependent oxidoreductase n=1 Tax=Fodinicurvata sp. EGI_FJ10296 TaxID=3231908 RepID=UPI003456DAE3
MRSEADPPAESADIVVIGGAAMGSAVACHLALDPAFSGRVVVIERDPSYQFCATARSAASIRQQFSTPLNIDISLYGIQAMRSLGDDLAVDGDRPDIALTEGGYLFLATPEKLDILDSNHRIQTQRGADILRLSPDDLSARFPWLAVDDIAGGCWGRSGEGWYDGYGLMRAFRRRAVAGGVTYRTGVATGVTTAGGRVTGVRLADGGVCPAAVVVDCAGTAAAGIAMTCGVAVPVHSRKRMVFTFTCPDPVPDMPLVVDPGGVYCRPEGQGFICGMSPPADRDPDCYDYDVDHTLFEETIWPVLARRIPAFERLRTGPAWAGHYDMNVFDSNAIVGGVPGVEGFYMATGFSGHGLQQAPAVGRGLAELIVHGGYRSLDLSPLGIGRLIRGEPLREINVV